MELRNLVVETTRQCNLACYHCLRGDTQKMKMKPEYIDSLLDQLDSIGTVVFTGGEPSLNVPIMEYFLEGLKKRNIDVESFYIATNGIKVPENFVMFCLKMYSYCSDKEQCSVQVSNDYPHGIEDVYNIELLQGLSFFSKKFEKDSYNYGSDAFLKPEGRAVKFGHGTNVVSTIDTEDDLYDVDFYLNCKGEIINGCDWSYKSQPLHKICDVGELSKFIEAITLQEVD